MPWPGTSSTVHVVTTAQATAQDISYSLFSFVRFAYEPRKLLALYQELAGESVSRVDENTEVAVKVLWTMATFDAYYPRLYRRVMASLAEQDLSSVPLAVQCEIILAHKFASEHGCAAAAVATLPVRAVVSVRDASFIAAWSKAAVRCCRLRCDQVPSLIHTDSRRCLMLAARYEDQWNRALLHDVEAHLLQKPVGRVVTCDRTHDGMFHVDVLLPDMRVSGRAVAIEVLDMQHLSANTRQGLGRHLLRQRLLKSYGYHVVTLSASAWEAQEPADLLDTLLADAELRRGEAAPL
jgi:hypothetical protein